MTSDNRKRADKLPIIMAVISIAITLFFLGYHFGSKKRASEIEKAWINGVNFGREFPWKEVMSNESQ